jgi:hypothetical protein
MLRMNAESDILEICSGFVVREGVDLPRATLPSWGCSCSFFFSRAKAVVAAGYSIGERVR